MSMFQRKDIVQLLREAAELLDCDDTDYRSLLGEKAAWRLADAGADLRVLLEKQGTTSCLGLSHPTVNGALLPLVTNLIFNGVA